MRFVSGFRNNIVMVKNSDKFSITAYTIADAIESNKDEKILGITKDGISKEDFEEDIVTEAVVLSRDELISYYLKMYNFGCDVTDIYIRMPYKEMSDEKLMSLLLSTASLYTSERRSYSELVYFAVENTATILLLDLVALKDKYSLAKSVKDKVIGDIRLGDALDIC